MSILLTTKLSTCDLPVSSFYGNSLEPVRWNRRVMVYDGGILLFIQYYDGDKLLFTTDIAGNVVYIVDDFTGELLEDDSGNLIIED